MKQTQNLIKRVRTAFEQYWKGLIDNIIKCDETGNLNSFPIGETAIISKLNTFIQSIDGFESTIMRKYEDDDGSTNKKKNLNVVGLFLNPKIDEFNVYFGLGINTIKGHGEIYLVSKFENESLEVSSSRFSHIDIDGTLIEVRNFLGKFVSYQNESKKIIDNLVKLEEAKEQKIVEIMEQNINAVIPQMMASAGYIWNLHYDVKRELYVLQIKLKKSRMIEINLNENNFLTIIPELLTIIAQIYQLFEKVPSAVNVKSCGQNIDWKTGNTLI